MQEEAILADAGTVMSAVNGGRGAAPEPGAGLLALLAPKPGERILDLGCGDGALTARIAAAGADVVGVDCCPDMVAAARARGLDVVLADAEALAFDRAFDAVFCHAALHWMRDHEAVTAGVARALRPGGRYVAECGDFARVAAIMTALQRVLRRHGIAEPNLPAWQPCADGYGELLTRHGFTVRTMAQVPRPAPPPAGLTGWLEVFVEAALAALPAAERAAAQAEALATLRPWLGEKVGAAGEECTRLRFAAVTPARQASAGGPG